MSYIDTSDSTQSILYSYQLLTLLVIIDIIDIKSI